MPIVVVHRISGRPVLEKADQPSNGNLQGSLVYQSLQVMSMRVYPICAVPDLASREHRCHPVLPDRS